jgi:hypothetical protein
MREFNVDGMINGRPAQSVLEASTSQKYPVGTIYEAYGSRWRYCHAVAAITPGKRGCPNMARSSWDGATFSMGSDETTVTGSAGDRKVLITTGATYDESHVLDVFVGGILAIFPTVGTYIYQHRIMGNEPSYGSDVYMNIFIDPPLAADCAAVACDVMPSPYQHVGAPASVGTGYSVVCVPAITVAQYSYFWGQTRGPCFITPNAEWTTASTREAEFHTDGTIKAGAGVALQRAGYVLYYNGTAADSYVQLMLE